MTPRSVLLIASSAVILSIGIAARATAAPALAALRWQARVLIVFAAEDDPRLAAQGEIAATGRAAFRERDLRLIRVVGRRVRGATDAADDLRRRFRVPPDAFAAILIGKDGGEKLRSAEPIPAARLAAVIDAMPMRRDEFGRR